MTSRRIHPAKGMNGDLALPGDKSISHRVVIMAGLASGKSTIKNLLIAEDVLATIRILQQLGVKMSHRPESILSGDTLEIEGNGLGSLKRPEGILDCGNSGTTMRLMLGVLASQPFESTLTGDESLNKRPMDRVIEPLKKMGARFQVLHRNGKRFITVTGQKNLKGEGVDLPVASAQVKSALLLSALGAGLKMEIREPTRSRDHTEKILEAMGAPISIHQNVVRLGSVREIKPMAVTVPGDFSSCSFHLVGALILPGSDVTLRGVGVNPTRTGLLDALRSMGAHMEIEEEPPVGHEPVATVRVTGSPLQGTTIGGPLIPLMIDEIPIFCIAAAAANEKSEVSDARELRVKESDRISVMCRELTKLGVRITQKEDGLLIEGTPSWRGSIFDSAGDHRIAMSFAIAALRCKGSSEIRDVGCVATSYPSFFDDLDRLVGKSKSRATNKIV